MNTSRDGCIEFDAALMDAAAGDPQSDATREHLAHCARCTRALADYRITLGALAHDDAVVAPRGGARTPSLRSFTWLHAAAVLILVAIGARLASSPQSPAIVDVAAVDARPADPTIDAHPQDGAALTRLNGDTARLDSGVCTFLMGAAMGVVETPLGAFSCKDCAFTVSIGPPVELDADDSCGDDTHVQISVLRGFVATSMLDRPRMLSAGQTMTISGP